LPENQKQYPLLALTAPLSAYMGRSPHCTACNADAV